MENKKAIISGAGVAGLTAADRLLDSTVIKPVIYEMTEDIGGIAKTVNHNGNRMDIGGHRFFSKSDEVMNYWQKMMPLAKESYDDQEKILMIRSRVSRILYMKKFFDYPVKVNRKTIRNLGMIRMTWMGLSYIKSSLFPVKPEASLEDFLINRFGKELYKTFFRDYTEKVWGVACDQIEPE